MGRWDRYSRFPKYVSVGEMAEKAAKIVARMRKQGANLNPIVIEGRTIAKTFWGKAWCNNIESYRDLHTVLSAEGTEHSSPTATDAV